MIQLGKIPLYNGIFHEMSKRSWEYLPRSIERSNIDYQRIFEYLKELTDRDDDWFVIIIMFIIGMNEFRMFKVYYQKQEAWVMIEHFMSLCLFKRGAMGDMVLKFMDSKIDLYNLTDIDGILEMIDMLNKGFNIEKFLMMKMTYYLTP